MTRVVLGVSLTGKTICRHAADARMRRKQRKTVNRLVRRRTAQRSVNPDLRYRELLAERYAGGLVSPFRCSGCGQETLDVLGWDGKRRPLCDACSDGLTMEAQR